MNVPKTNRKCNAWRDIARRCKRVGLKTPNTRQRAVIMRGCARTDCCGPIDANTRQTAICCLLYTSDADDDM
eukprot:6718788-Lingulodinium_polyedra.AAC.1